MKPKILINKILCQLGIRKILPAEVINNKRVIESNEPVEEITSLKTVNWRTDKIIVRKTVAEMLVEANGFLPEGFQLVLIEGFRNLEKQEKGWETRLHETRKKYPNKTNSEIEKLSVVFTAKPGGSGHYTGGAIDLTIAGPDGSLLDMETKYAESSEKSHTYSNNIASEQIKNRKILIDAMKKAGFVNYPAEWWHWCYGDRMWAAYARKPFAIYGNIEN